MRLLREHGEELQQVLGRGRLHLAAVIAHEALPHRGRLLALAVHPAQQLRARRKLGHPGVEEILARVVLLLHAARRTAHGAQARPLAGIALGSQLHDTDRHPESLNAFIICPCRRPSPRSPPIPISSSTWWRPTASSPWRASSTPTA